MGSSLEGEDEVLLRGTLKKLTTALVEKALLQKNQKSLSLHSYIKQGNKRNDYNDDTST